MSHVSGPLTADDRVLKDAVQRASDSDVVDWNLRVDCVGPERIRSMSLVAGEVGVWDLKTQVTVDEEARRALARRLLDADFFALEREYGGKTSPDSAPSKEPPPAFALRVICRVEVESVVAGERVRRSSVQYAEGQQSAELAKLANALLDQIAPLAEEGVQPRDFAHAIELLRDGAIDRRLLRARLVQLPPKGSETPGVIFRLEEGWASVQPYSPGKLVGDVTLERLDDLSLRTIVQAVVETGFEQLPVNLWAEEQVELHLGLLGQERAVYGRPFSRLENEQDAASQHTFKELLVRFRQLADSVD